jgi:multicomponent Na+:H+ antiporter subunit B
MIHRALIAGLLVLLALPLMYAMAELPPHGSPDSPAYTHVAPRYLERGPEEAGAENVVTDIILNYRGLDTHGEVTVIFTAMAAVLAVLLGTGATPRSDAAPPERNAPSVVVSFIVRIMAPFIATFAIYVVLNGHVTPGGGFQGGTILGALVIALTLVMDRQEASRLLPRRPERLLQAAAPLTFLVVGLAGLFAFGSYLAYPGAGPLAWLTTALLVVVEIGIGVGGAMVIATILRTMEGER